MTWPGFRHFIYFLFWHYLFPFLVRGGGSTGLIQIKVPRILVFFFAHLLTEIATSLATNTDIGPRCYKGDIEMGQYVAVT